MYENNVYEYNIFNTFFQGGDALPLVTGLVTR